jgi:ATP-dependent HslUV protease ATP-binding subunit HslU
MTESSLTPKQIVDVLNRYIVGQDKAKRAVAVALRNRFRRRRLPQELQDEIMPKNIIMIGPTGVGKTEIARRLAKLVNAPFVKVEASKFTEVGYVGRDVDSMIRDLVETSIRMVKQEKMAAVRERAEQMAKTRLLELIHPAPRREKTVKNPFELLFTSQEQEEKDARSQDLEQQYQNQKQVLAAKLARGELEQEYIEIEVEDSMTPMVEVFSGQGVEELGINLQDMLGGLFPKKKKKRKMTVAEARKILINQEAQKLVDMDEVISEAVQRAEQSGIIFLDEIDKIAGRDSSYGPDVSRGGVQRDILPIVEGSTVMTKYGPVKTDHILFIAAGAFHVSKPSDLIPELQGRFPIRVELDSLSKEDFQQILTEPEHSLLKQYVALLATEGVKVEFTPEGIEEIAEIAYLVNSQTENIGARRLHTILEKVLEEVSFNAPDIAGSITIDQAYVRERLASIIKNEDLRRFVL